MASFDQRFCEPCSRGDTTSQGYSRCSDCEEILCAVCDKAHRLSKLTLSHHLTYIHELPFLPRETFIKLRLCDNHPEKIVDFYCAFHDVVCCQTCILESHRACQQVEIIDDVSGGIKSSALVEDISKAVSSLLKTFDSIIENRKKNKDSVFSQETSIKTSIAKLKQDLLQHVDSIEKSLLTDLDNLKEETIESIENELMRSSNMRENWQKIKQELDFNKKHGSNNQLFRLAEKLKYNISKAETILKDKLTETMNVDLKCNIREDIFNTIIATVQAEKQPCGIKHIAQIQGKAQFHAPMLSFSPGKAIDLLPNRSTSISGIEVIDDKLLLCNCYDQRILMYKDDGTFVKEKLVEGKPYQIVLLSCGLEAAVTFYGSRNILIISTENLDFVRQVETEKPYCGLQPLSDSFIVGYQGLDIMSFDGKINRFIPLHENKLVRFIRKRKDDTILYTNSSKLTCLKLLDGTKVFEYASVMEPRGIAEDKYGCIYVADKGKKEIHRIGSDGSFIDIVLKESDGIGAPLSLRFSPDFSKLYVGIDQSNTLCVFLCK